MAKLVAVLLLILFIPLMPSAANAQSKGYSGYLEQLLGEINAMEMDTNRAFQYNAIAIGYRVRQDYDLVKLYADSSMELSRKLAYESGILAAHASLCDYHNYQESYDSAYVHGQKYLALAKKTAQKQDDAKSYNQLGKVYSKLSQYDSSLVYYQKAHDLYQELGLNFEQPLAVALGDIASTYQKTDRLEEAIFYLKKSQEKFGQMRDGEYKERNIKIAQNKLAEIYFMNGQDAEAKELLENVIANSQYKEAQNQLARANYTLGNHYTQKKEYKKAELAYKKAIEIHKSNNTLQKLPIFYSALTSMYIESNQLDKTEETNAALIALFETYNFPKLEAQHLLNQSKIAEATGNWKGALALERSYHHFQDSLRNLNNNQNLSALQAQFTYSTQIKEIGQLEQANELKDLRISNARATQLILWIGLAGLLVIAILVWFIYRNKLKNQKKLFETEKSLEQEKTDRQLSGLELKALRAQINPHFMFNCLSAIQRFVLEGKTEDASRSLSKFSKLIRQILENSDEEEVSVAAEVEMLKSYLDLEVQRFKNKVKYKINIAENIDAEDDALPPMILQPFIENSLHHGLHHKAEGGEIKIDISREGDNLLCSIEDDGVGRAAAQERTVKLAHKNKSMGMKVTEERLRLLFPEHPRSLVKIIDLKDGNNLALGTRVELKIPA